VQSSEHELHWVLVPKVTQVPLQQTLPPEQGAPPPQEQVPLRHVSATLLSQVTQAEPPIPQAVADGTVQVALRQQPLRQVAASQVGGVPVAVAVWVGVSVGVLVAVGVSVAVWVGVGVKSTQRPLSGSQAVPEGQGAARQLVPQTRAAGQQLRPSGQRCPFWQQAPDTVQHWESGQSRGHFLPEPCPWPAFGVDVTVAVGPTVGVLVGVRVGPAVAVLVGVREARATSGPGGTASACSDGSQGNSEPRAAGGQRPG
jgi:hypothetical protein